MLQGLETAKRALFSQQSAIHTAGHNISNANTEGFSRQRVNMSQTAPISGVSRNRLDLPGQIGTGVEAGSVERIRDRFFDFQYRMEMSKVGYYEARSESLSRMENLLNEPSEQGLGKTMDRFWQSLQDLAVDPEHSGTRSVVRERGKAVADTFNYLTESLQAIQQDLKDEIDTKVTTINTIAQKINKLNMEISHLENNDYLPNDLYDDRDRLVDELSEIVDIKVTATKSGNAAMAMADGVYTIDIIGDDGHSLFGSTKLVNGNTNTVESLTVHDDGPKGSISELILGDMSIQATEFTSMGELKALMEGFGFENEEGETTGIYPDMLKALDNMAYTFAREFNTVHQNGMSPNEIENGFREIPFFADTVDERVATYPKDTTDIVFVLDISGSMDDDIETISKNLAAFADEIKDSSSVKDIQFGLVKYIGGYENTIFSNENVWGSDEDINENLQEIITALRESPGLTDLGLPANFYGHENLMNALEGILPVYGQNETFKHIVFLTDEGDHGELSSSDIIEQFKERGIQVHGIFDPGTSDGNVKDLENIVEGSGGVSLDIKDDNWADDLINVMGTSIGEYIESAGTGEFGRDGYASRIKVSEEVLTTIDNIASAQPEGGAAHIGDSENVSDLADVFDEAFSYSPSDAEDITSFREYYQRVIGDLGVASQEVQRMQRNTETLKQTVNERRQSVSSVSLDEEMANLIQFQHAYNAAARSMTLVDEMLDRIINQM
ncbi:flagellar hook-associated protein FlgK [Oceanobacillus halotolerans]|uniref:flagellar hook-associated protein FlgK n=1 Tax=Oceanobacillus halotolerans TaxID=2663380 RepID=UPI001CF7ABFB|nr:flagellar hook-associated protein FlgK [Oceanobacillus halotolerans]